MINFGYMTSLEFSELYKKEDIVCVLAQALAEESMGKGYNIVNKKDFIRHRYIELAKDLIEKLKKHDLIITPKFTEGVTDNEKE